MADRTLNFKVSVTADSKIISEREIKEEIEVAVAANLKSVHLDPIVKVVRLRTNAQTKRG